MLAERVSEDLKAAMRSKDAVALRALRMLRTELRYREDEARRQLRPEEEAACVKSAIQRRIDAAALFRTGGREDLAQAEDEEREFLRRYLPQQLGEEEMARAIDEAIAEVRATGQRDFGRVMKAVMGRIAGRADGAVVSSMVKDRLNAMT